MGPPVEEKPSSNGLEARKQEREEPTANPEPGVPTPRPTPQEHTAVEQGTPPTHTADVYYGGNIEEPISVSCAARCSQNSLQLLQVDSDDDDSTIGELSQL